jgi:hypothetical protein
MFTYEQKECLGSWPLNAFEGNDDILIDFCLNIFCIPLPLPFFKGVYILDNQRPNF